MECKHRMPNATFMQPFCDLAQGYTDPVHVFMNHSGQLSSATNPYGLVRRDLALGLCLPKSCAFDQVNLEVSPKRESFDICRRTQASSRGNQRVPKQYQRISLFASTFFMPHVIGCSSDRGMLFYNIYLYRHVCLNLVGHHQMHELCRGCTLQRGCVCRRLKYHTASQVAS